VFAKQPLYYSCHTPSTSSLFSWFLDRVLHFCLRPASDHHFPTYIPTYSLQHN
jgi:hypothetical protein